MNKTNFSQDIFLEDSVELKAKSEMNEQQQRSVKIFCTALIYELVAIIERNAAVEKLTALACSVPKLEIHAEFYGLSNNDRVNATTSEAPVNLELEPQTDFNIEATIIRPIPLDSLNTDSGMAVHDDTRNSKKFCLNDSTCPIVICELETPVLLHDSETTAPDSVLIELNHPCATFLNGYATQFPRAVASESTTFESALACQACTPSPVEATERLTCRKSYFLTTESDSTCIVLEAESVVDELTYTKISLINGKTFAKCDNDYSSQDQPSNLKGSIEKCLTTTIKWDRSQQVDAQVDQFSDNSLNNFAIHFELDNKFSNGVHCVYTTPNHSGVGEITAAIPQDGFCEKELELRQSNMNNSEISSMWIARKNELERRAEHRAQQTYRRWQREKRTLEEAIDESLKEYIDLHEISHALRLKMEHSQSEWRSKVFQQAREVAESLVQKYCKMDSMHVNSTKRLPREHWCCGNNNCDVYTNNVVDEKSEQERQSRTATKRNLDYDMNETSLEESYPHLMKKQQIEFDYTVDDDDFCDRSNICFGSIQKSGIVGDDRVQEGTGLTNVGFLSKSAGVVTAPKLASKPFRVARSRVVPAHFNTQNQSHGVIVGDSTATLYPSRKKRI